MIIIITGASHTGKTALAQRLLEKYGYPYLSEDHLKMGLIRSGNTALTPLSSDTELTEYLWPIVCEMIKTAIENRQNLIVEGCYIPVDWKKYFADEYRDSIIFRCLVMSEDYIRLHEDDIFGYANVIEKRLDDNLTVEDSVRENRFFLEECRKHDSEYILIDGEYEVDIDFSVKE
ncbi:MAG: AAA family ATPase [Oscillospiraceae bacterium]|nr:AAA family ATPase [Oscillospiraceae bacterium]